MIFYVLELSERGIGMIIYATFSLYLCFMAGKLYLIKIGNALINILSLLPLVIVTVAIVGVSYGNPGSIGNILVIPTFPMSEVLAYFTHIERKYAYMIMSILPSLAMWIGVHFKKL